MLDGRFVLPSSAPYSRTCILVAYEAYEHCILSPSQALICGRHVPHHVSVKHLILELEAHDINVAKNGFVQLNAQDMSQLLDVKNIGKFFRR